MLKVFIGADARQKNLAPARLLASYAVATLPPMGRRRSGPRALGARSMAPLTDKHLDIERRRSAGESRGSIAKAFGMTRSAVARAEERIASVRSLEMVQRSWSAGDSSEPGGKHG